MKKVLIVEDDVDINRALRIRLEASGYEVHSAQDGVCGLTTAVREKPDLMVLDISMPGGNGFSIVERLRDNTELPRIPFIILTASKRPELKLEAEELGAAAFFEKPFESSSLVAAIDEAINNAECPAER